MTTPPPPPPPPPANSPIDEDTLKRALTAFKKRYKLTKLDQESKLGGKRALTGGKDANLAGIIPPREFPPAVWSELARQGRIRDTGGGFFGPT